MTGCTSLFLSLNKQLYYNTRRNFKLQAKSEKKAGKLKSFFRALPNAPLLFKIKENTA